MLENYPSSDSGSREDFQICILQMGSCTITYEIFRITDVLIRTWDGPRMNP